MDSSERHQMMATLARLRAELPRLVVGMAGIGLLAMCFVIWTLYETAFDEERARLVDTARSQAQLIEAVARFNASQGPAGAGVDHTAATLSIIEDAHSKYPGIGETGEFTMARRDGLQIVFLLRHRHYDLDKPKPVAWESETAEPMRRALKGLSGTVVGQDYRGETVLAAFEPIAFLGLGIVAKIDISEVRAPFVKAMLVSLLGVVLVLLVGLVLYRRVAAPIRVAENSVAALAESESRLSAIFDNVPFSLVLKNRDLKYEYINKTLAAWFGRTPEEVIGRTLAEVQVSPGAAEEHSKLEMRVLETGEVSRQEITLTKPGCGPVDWILIKFPIRSADGDISGVGTAALDVTEQKKVEKALRDSEQRLKDFADSASDWMWETDEEHKFTFISERYYQATGIPLERMMGKSRWQPVVGSEADSALWREHQADLDARRPFRRLRYKNVNHAGEPVWYETSGVPVYDSEGVFKGYRGTGNDITELMRIETELQRTQEMTQALLDHIPASVGLRSPEGDYILVNRCFEEWTTLSRNELNTPEAKRIWPGAYDEKIAKRHQEVTELGQSETVEQCASFPDGNTRDVQLTVFPVYMDNSKFIGTGFVNMDVTEIRKSERLLLEKDAELRTILDNAPIAITLTDLDERILLVNRLLAETYGYRPEDLIGGDLRDLLSPSQYRSAKIHRDEVVETRSTIAKDRVDILPNGKPSTRLSIKFPIISPEGEVTAVGTISFDDKEHRKTREERQQLETQLKTIIDHFQSAIAVKDTDGRYLSVNNIYTKWYGVSDKELLDDNAWEHFSPARAVRIAAQDQQILEYNETLVWEEEILFLDGERHTVFIKKFPIPGPNGRPESIGSIATDITALRRAEEQLSRTEKMAALGQAVAGFALDANDLLHGIAGDLERLSETVAEDGQPDSLTERALAAARQGMGLNRRLLALSRNLHPKPQALSLNERVSDIVDTIQPGLGGDIDLATEFDDNLWPCAGDPVSIESAVLLIAVAAVSAAGNEGKLTMRTENLGIADGSGLAAEQLPQGEYVKLSVSVDGASPELLAVERDADPEAGDVLPGGFGLHAASALARLSGGLLVVETPAGAATVVALYLPRSILPAPDEEVERVEVDSLAG